MITSKRPGLRGRLETDLKRLDDTVASVEAAIEHASVDGQFAAEEALESILRDLRPLPKRMKAVIEYLPREA